MKDLSIGKRLAMGFGIIAVILVALMTMAIVNMKRMDSTFDQVMNLNAKKIEKANGVIKNIDQIYYNMAMIIMTKDPAVAEENGKLLAGKRKDEGADLETLANLEQTEKGKELIARQNALASQGKAANNEAMELAKAGKHEEAAEIYVKGRAFAMQNIAAMEDLVRHEQEEMEAAHQAALKKNFAYGFTLMCLGGLALAVIVVTTIYLSRSITIPLKEGVRIADSLARGDLEVQVVVDRKDEVGHLLGSMKNMVEKWRDVIGQVSSTATSLSSAATELSASAEQMSRGSNTQAERASFVATSSEEMSQTVLDVARSAGDISKSADNTATAAREGGAIVNRAVNEVKEIAVTVNNSAQFVKSLGDRSKQIGEIVGVINDIADQTNLLALNAAIEAARAGDQGRGFAVVADEVRKLAERTAHSTSEIGGMIKAIQDEVDKAVGVMAQATSKVDDGVKYSEEAGRSLEVIVKSVEDLQLMVQQIASATEEMSATSDQISKDIDQIAIVSREASTSSEQSALASGELANLSVNLEKVVGEFRV